MSYSIIGLGEVGQTLARAFARKGIAVSVATTRDPESFGAAATAIEPGIRATTLAEAVKADVIFLAVRFRGPGERRTRISSSASGIASGSAASQVSQASFAAPCRITGIAFG